MADFPVQDGQIIIQPPATAGGLADGLAGYSSGENAGPHRYGNNLYVMGNRTGSQRPSVNKSTDNGVTWVTYPTPDIAGTATTSSPVFDATNGVFRLVYKGTTLKFRDFNLVSETWGSEIDSSSTVDGGVLARKLSNGDTFVFYRVTSGGTYAFRKIVSGAWGAATTYNFNVRWLTIDSDNTAHVVYQTAGYWSGNLVYNTITSGGTIGTPATIAANQISGAAGFPYSNFIVDETNNRLIFGYSRAPVQAVPQADGNSFAYAFIGTPISAPVWTAYDIHGNLTEPVAPNDVWQDYYLFIVPSEVDANIVHFFWNSLWLNNDPFNDVSAVYRADWSFLTNEVGNPYLVWNLITVHAPLTTQKEAAEYFPDALSVLMEDYVFYFNMEMSPITDNLNTGYVSFTIDRTPVAIVCNNPPAGTVGVAYGPHSFIATGQGTLEYSIVAGELPPGLTMDTLTGIVTGTPTEQGEYFFTVQARSV